MKATLIWAKTFVYDEKAFKINTKAFYDLSITSKENQNKFKHVQKLNEVNIINDIKILAKPLCEGGQIIN